MEYTIEFNQPVETVFRYLEDVTLLKQWIGGLVSIEAIGEGGNRVGAKAKHIYEENGRKIEMIEEMLIYIPNKHIKIHGVTDGFELTAEYILEPTPTGTRLHYVETLDFKSWFMKLLSPFIKASSKAQLEKGFARLKELLAS